MLSHPKTWSRPCSWCCRLRTEPGRPADGGTCPGQPPTTFRQVTCGWSLRFAKTAPKSDTLQNTVERIWRCDQISAAAAATHFVAPFISWLNCSLSSPFPSFWKWTHIAKQLLWQKETYSIGQRQSAQLQGRVVTIKCSGRDFIDPI